MAVVFPENFNHDLLHQNKATIQIIADASDPNIANTLTNYLSTIITDYQTELNGNATNALPDYTGNKNVVQPTVKRSSQFCSGRDGAGAYAGLRYDDSHFHCKGKRNRHDGNSYWYHLLSQYWLLYQKQFLT